MIDIHCHILPYLDDGPQSMNQALRMASIAVSEGVHTIIATPHHANGHYENVAEKIRRSVIDFNHELRLHNIPLHVLPGQEVRVHANLIEEVLHGNIIALNEGSYVLLELPSTQVPSFFQELLHELQVLHITPILAHPERNAVIMRQPILLYNWIEQGMRTQITSHSLTGLFGRKIQRFAFRLCRKNMVHFIASDGHRPDLRPNRLKPAYDLVERQFGLEQVRLFKQNALQLIECGTIEVRTPSKFLGRWFFHF